LKDAQKELKEAQKAHKAGSTPETQAKLTEAETKLNTAKNSLKNSKTTLKAAAKGAKKPIGTGRVAMASLFVIGVGTVASWIFGGKKPEDTDTTAKIPPLVTSDSTQVVAPPSLSDTTQVVTPPSLSDSTQVVTPPSGDGTQPPAGDGTQPPAGDGTQPPAGNGTQPPAGNGTQTPSGTQTNKVIVQNGETLIKLANKYGVSAQKIIELNKNKIKYFRHASNCNDNKKYAGFLVGAEITLPDGIYDLSGNKLKADTIKDYEDYIVKKKNIFCQDRLDQICTSEFRQAVNW
jgi:LysM repeat protein